MPSKSSAWTTQLLLSSFPMGFDALALRSSLESHQLNAWRNCFEKLLSFAVLTDEAQDGGPRAPSTAILETAAELIRHMTDFPAPDRLIAGPDGEIVFEWHGSEGYTEAEVSTAGEVEWMHRDPAGAFTHWEWRVPTMNGFFACHSDKDHVASVSETLVVNERPAQGSATTSSSAELLTAA